MTKEDFIRLTSLKSGVTQKDIRIVIEAMSDIIFDVISREDSVKFGSVCTFSGVTRPAKTVRNPKTGEAKHVEEQHGYPKCKFSSTSKTMLEYYNAMNINKRKKKKAKTEEKIEEEYTI